MYVSEGQAAVELFFRLNHARQTMDYVRRQVTIPLHPFQWLRVHAHAFITSPEDLLDNATAAVLQAVETWCLQAADSRRGLPYPALLY